MYPTVRQARMNKHTIVPAMIVPAFSFNSFIVSFMAYLFFNAWLYNGIR